MEKVFFYIDTLYRGGAQRVMSVLVTYFYKKGYEVSLINDFKQDDAKPHYKIPEGITRYYLEPEQGRRLKNIYRIYHLRKIVEEKKPDIMVSFLGNPNIRFLIGTLGMPLIKVVSVRSDPSKEYDGVFYKKAIARCLFLSADGWVFQVPDAVGFFSKKVRKGAKILLNPVSNSFFEQERQVEPANIISIGRIDKGKNHKLLIDAFELIKDIFPNDNLIIYGDGPLRKELEQYCETKGLKERVQFPGIISDVTYALSVGKLFVLTSNYEGLPNVLMEAMAIGIPCISTDCPCGGPKYLSVDEKAVKLVPCNDVDTLSCTMRTVLEDKKAQRDMVKHAKNRAEDFRENLVCREWEQYLKMLCMKGKNKN